MTVTLFSVNTQLSFMVCSHKPCINKKVNLRAYCHYHSHTKLCPCFVLLCFVSSFYSAHKERLCLGQ